MPVRMCICVNDALDSVSFSQLSVLENAKQKSLKYNADGGIFGIFKHNMYDLDSQKFEITEMTDRAS